MQNQIQEYELEVSKKYNNIKRCSLGSLITYPKPKTTRTLMIHDRPKIQIASPTKLLFKEIDISEAAGLFLGFESPGRPRQFKLILKNKVLTFYETNKFNFNQLKTDLENVIERFHQNRESGGSCNTKDNAVMHEWDYLLNLQYDVPEFDKDKEIIYSVDSVKDNFPNSICRTFQDLIKEITYGGGIKVDLTDDRKDKYTIAILKDQLWVANVKYGDNGKRKLHFGDLVVAVDGISVNTMFLFQESIRNKTKFSIAIQRLPKAKAFLSDINSSNPLKFITKKNKLTLVESKTKWIVTEVNGEFTLDVLNQKHKDMISSSSGKQNLVVAHKKEFVKQIQNSQHSHQI